LLKGVQVRCPTTRTHWHVLTDTRNERKAEKLLRRLEAEWARPLMEFRVEKHHRRGHRVTFTIDHADRSRAEAIVDAIALAEFISGPGRWWKSGSVEDDFGMTSDGPARQGLDFAEGFLLTESACVFAGRAMPERPEPEGRD